MTVLQKGVQSERSLEKIPGFHETFKSAYSHGLEAIYSIETVDLKSVRKMAEAVPSKQERRPKVASQEYIEEQPSFDLGAAYRDWMVPHTLQEPIQVLQLSKHVEKALLEKGLCSLGALQKANWHDISLLRGLGQGHIEDVRGKLQAYIAEKPIQKSTSIDFLSLFKCLCGDLERKKVCALLEPHGLAEWLSLTPLEGMELRRAAPDVYQEWGHETQKLLLGGDKRDFLFAELGLLIQTWIVPWLWRRGRVATASQIYEALILRSADEELGEHAVPLLFSWAPLHHFLPQIEGVFAASEADAVAHKELIALASTYFVHPDTSYGLTELENLLRAELATQWRSMPHLSQQLVLGPFHCYRDPKGQWRIKSAQNF